MVIPPLFTSANTVGGTIRSAPGGGAGVPSFLKEFASLQSQASSSATQVALGGGPSIASVMVGAANADVGAESFSLLVSRALSAYQEVMQMQV